MEAARAVYDYGKTELGLTNIEVRAHCDNLGSLRIIEKLGFVWLNNYETSVGRFRRHGEPDSAHQEADVPDRATLEASR